MNRVQIIGHLGRDPEIRSLPKGGEVANLRIATSESYKDKATQARVENTEWHSVAVYVGFMVDRCRTLRKGDRVMVEGALRTRSYTDRDQREQRITEIVVKPFNGSVEPMRARDSERGGRDNDRDERSTPHPSENSGATRRQDQYADRRPDRGPRRSNEPNPSWSRNTDQDDEIPF